MDNNIEQLMKLKQLYEAGVLSKEEMEAEKAKILCAKDSGQKTSVNTRTSSSVSEAGTSSEKKETGNTEAQESIPVSSKTASRSSTNSDKERGFLVMHKAPLLAAIIIAIVGILIFLVRSLTGGSNVHPNSSESYHAQIVDSITGEIVNATEENDTEDTGNWEFGYFHDEFGEDVKDDPYIRIKLKAHEVNRNDKSGYIYVYYSAEGFRFTTSSDFCHRVSVKTCGDIHEIETIAERDKSICENSNDQGLLFFLMEVGNFSLKVGDLIAEITSSTQFFHNALIKMMKDQKNMMNSHQSIRNYQSWCVVGFSLNREEIYNSGGRANVNIIINEEAKNVEVDGLDGLVSFTICNMWGDNYYILNSKTGQHYIMLVTDHTEDSIISFFPATGLIPEADLDNSFQCQFIANKLAE